MLIALRVSSAEAGRVLLPVLLNLPLVPLCPFFSAANTIQRLQTTINDAPANMRKEKGKVEERGVAGESQQKAGGEGGVTTGNEAICGVRTTNFMFVFFYYWFYKTGDAGNRYWNDLEEAI